MIRVWRLARAPYARDPLSGRGGLVAAGRWHERGVRIVYTSATLSLAALELLVHVDKDLAPQDLVQIEFGIPPDLKIADISSDVLPRGWRRYPGPPALQKLGADWLSSGQVPVLRVPSALIPEESNYLLNPAHPAIAKVRVVSRRSFSFDSRLMA